MVYGLGEFTTTLGGGGYSPLPEPVASFDISKDSRTRHLEEIIRRAGNSVIIRHGQPKNTEEMLFSSRAMAKRQTSLVSMRMDKDYRSALFRQLDSLLDSEEWQEGDIPLSVQSYTTFLKLLFLLIPGRRPGLALTGKGNILAIWQNGANRLTIECLPSDKVKWVLAYEVDGEMERVAGQAHLNRLSEHLAAFNLERWFAR